MDKTNSKNKKEKEKIDTPVQDSSAEAPSSPELEQLTQRVNDLENQLAKERANLLNYQSSENARYQNKIASYEKNLLFDLINIIDNFEHTIQMLKKQKDASNESFLQGVEMIYNQFLSFLASKNCHCYESLDKPFDPNIHEALSTIEDQTRQENIVAEELCKGYTHHNAVLRPAKVKVVKNKQNNN